MKKSNYITMVLFFISLYAMYLVGQFVALQRIHFTIGGEVFLPIMLVILFSALQKNFNKVDELYSSYIGTIPLAAKRFTRIDTENNMVHIDEKEVNDAILYIAEVENWLDGKNI